MNFSNELIQTIRKIPKLLHRTCVFCFLDNVNIIHIGSSNRHIKSSTIIIHEETKLESQINGNEIKNNLILIFRGESDIPQTKLDLILKNHNPRGIQLIFKEWDTHIGFEIISRHLSDPGEPMQILKGDLAVSPNQFLIIVDTQSYIFWIPGFDERVHGVFMDC